MKLVNTFQVHSCSHTFCGFAFQICSLETGFTHSVVQAGLELVSTLLPQPLTGMINGDSLPPALFLPDTKYCQVNHHFGNLQHMKAI